MEENEGFSLWCCFLEGLLSHLSILFFYSEQRRKQREREGETGDFFWMVSITWPLLSASNSGSVKSSSRGERNDCEKGQGYGYISNKRLRSGVFGNHCEST